REGEKTRGCLSALGGWCRLGQPSFGSSFLGSPRVVSPIYAKADGAKPDGERSAARWHAQRVGGGHRTGARPGPRPKPDRAAESPTDPATAAGTARRRQWCSSGKAQALERNRAPRLADRRGSQLSPWHVGADSGVREIPAEARGEGTQLSLWRREFTGGGGI